MKFWTLLVFICFFSTDSFAQKKSFTSLDDKWNLKLTDKQIAILNQHPDFTIENAQEQFDYELSREVLGVIRLAILLNDETTKRQKRKLFNLLKKYHRQEKKSQLYLLKQKFF